MKKCEYTNVQRATGGMDKCQELELAKADEAGLPEFTREVPVSAVYTEKNGIVRLNFGWNCNVGGNYIRAKVLVYRKAEDVKELFRVNARDGTDSVCVSRTGCVYILRKSTREIAEALLRSYGRIKGALENIVGWLQSVLGSIYMISRVDAGAWSFDRRIAKDVLSYLELGHLKAGNRKKLCELITEKLAELHAGAVVLGNFTLNNLLLTRNSAFFTDLRGLRVTRKRQVAVEEFKRVMEYLFAIGVAERADIFHSVAHYSAMNEDACNEWYLERTGREPRNTYEVAARIEEEI